MPPLRISILFSMLVLFACTFPGPQKAVDENAHRLDSLFILPETLDSTALADALRALPPALVDTFYRRLLLNCYDVVNPECLKRLLRQYETLRPDDAGTMATSSFFRGAMHQWAARYDSAEYYYARAADWFERVPDTPFLCTVLSSRSGNFSMKGMSEKDIELKYRLMDLSRNDSALWMKNRSMLGNSLNKKSDFDQTLNLIPENSLAYFSARHDTVGWAYAMVVLGVAHYGKKQYAESLRYLDQALNLRRKARGVSLNMRCEAYYLCGRTLVSMGRYQEGLDTLKIAADLARNMPNLQGQPLLNQYIGEALFRLGRFQEADAYLLQSLAISLQREQLPSAKAAAQRLYESKKAQGQLPEALLFLEQCTTLKDSIAVKEKEKITRELIVKYETQEKEAQIKILKAQHRLAIQRNAWIAISLLLLFASGLVRYRLLVRQRQEKLMHEKMFAEAQAALMAKKIEAQEVELLAQRTRLGDYAQMLIERNQRLLELSTAQEKSLQPPQTDEWQIENTILTDADWAKFKQYFNGVYPEFISTLKTKYPNISAAELRIVMLTKMGLNIKESAAILGIGTESIKKARYRLKKKFNLSGDQLAE